MGERRAHALRRGQLCDQHRGLADDRIDEDLKIHGRRRGPRGVTHMGSNHQARCSQCSLLSSLRGVADLAYRSAALNRATRPLAEKRRRARIAAYWSNRRRFQLSVLARIGLWPIQRVRSYWSRFLLSTSWKQAALPWVAMLADHARNMCQMRNQRSPYWQMTLLLLESQCWCQPRMVKL